MDNLDHYLISQCHAEAYAKRQLSKPVTFVKQINPLSIASVKQRLWKQNYHNQDQ